MQNVAAFETASFVGLLAGSFGFPWAFAVVAVFPSWARGSDRWKGASGWHSGLSTSGSMSRMVGVA
jgi:hypothetical protein